MTPEDFLTSEEEQRIVQAIKDAEYNTSGEIRVHLESVNQNPTMEHAWEIFDKIGMFQTLQRNGVLFYLDINHKVFTVIGDEGINKVVPDNFWDSIKILVIQNFRKGKFADGLVTGIKEVGDKLSTYFPYQSDDVNELPDEISKN